MPKIINDNERKFKPNPVNTRNDLLHLESLDSNQFETSMISL